MQKITPNEMRAFLVPLMRQFVITTSAPKRAELGDRMQDYCDRILHRQYIVEPELAGIYEQIVEFMTTDFESDISNRNVDEQIMRFLEELS